MAITYDTFGPFDLERDGNKLRRGALNDFWRERSEDSPGLAGAIGVYIVSIQSKVGSKPKPWYVGKTDKGFKKRFFQQMYHFGDVLDNAKNGNIKIFLLARRTANRRAFMRPKKNPSNANDNLETMLIGTCLGQNQKLMNAMKVKHLKEIHVPGYMNELPGKRTKAASELNRMVKAK